MQNNPRKYFLLSILVVAGLIIVWNPHVSAQTEKISEDLSVWIKVPESMKPKPVKPMTQRLAIFADALLEEKIKGLQRSRPDKFTSELLQASAVELTDWLDETQKDREFQKLFRGSGPWTFVFLAMSPSSLHEGQDGLEAKRLPIRMTIKPKGENLDVELWGAYGLSFNFRIDAEDDIIST